MILVENFVKQGNLFFRYRGIIPLFLLIGVVAVMVFGGLGISNNNTYEYVCLGISVLGQVIRILVVGYSPANTSGRNTKEQVADQLNTTGIYSVIRHPLYVGNFFMWIGIAMLTANAWFVLFVTVLYWLYYERIMAAEEAFLAGKFGNDYLEWARVTPSIIPAFSQYKRAKQIFSWRKVIKKEKNGLAALFLIFWLIIAIRNMVVTKSLSLNFDYWTIYMIASLGIYFVIKFLKYKTTLLDEKGR
jgi:protein-S-isoprenylcysteine O-methyltransferase Ste14